MIAVAVQVSLKSKRLPKKAFKKILGKTVLEQIVSRIKKAEEINKIIICPTTEPFDRPLIRFARERLKLPVITAPVRKLLTQYYTLVKKYKPRAFLRVTADCPFVDPKLIDDMVKFWKKHRHLDFVTNNAPPTLPDGLDLEIYSSKGIEKLWKAIKQNPFDEEWYLPYLYKHRQQFKIHNLDQSIRGIDKNWRWVVDWPEDLAFARKIYEELGRGGKLFHSEDIRDLLKRKPELIKMNDKYAEKVIGGIRSAGYHAAKKKK